MESTESTIRWVADIGMFAYDRSREDSCVHATQTCRARCYNTKLERVFKGIAVKDVRNDAYWRMLTGEQVKHDLSRRRNQTERVRLCTRGEPLKDAADIDRLADIAKANPCTVFWVPTRAWRNPTMLRLVEGTLMGVHNVRVLASTDEETTELEWGMLKVRGWSTMHFDGNADAKTTPNGDRWFKCPKTHAHLVGHCSICKGGCFNGTKRVDVHLLEH